ncbi:MAG: hypothetical protein J0H68_08355 [Sphingobacteriia bacterium]|nr:hypothetical protein [Sphingobacteriia bacterium]
MSKEKIWEYSEKLRLITREVDSRESNNQQSKVMKLLIASCIILGTLAFLALPNSTARNLICGFFGMLGGVVSFVHLFTCTVINCIASKHPITNATVSDTELKKEQSEIIIDLKGEKAEFRNNQLMRNFDNNVPKSYNGLPNV